MDQAMLRLLAKPKITAVFWSVTFSFRCAWIDDRFADEPAVRAKARPYRDSVQFGSLKMGRGSVKCGGRRARFPLANSGARPAGRAGSSSGSRFWRGPRGATPFWFGQEAC